MSSKTIALALVLASSINASFDCKFYQNGQSTPARQISYDLTPKSTGCRGMGKSVYDKVEFDSSKYKMEFFEDWGCAGKIDYTCSDPEKVLPPKPYHSCRVVPIDGPQHPISQPAGGAYEPVNPSGNFTVTNGTDTYAAVLYGEPGFEGMKRWIDGTIDTDDCRGLSEDPIGSTKLVKYPGADPDTDPAVLEDGVSLAFYSDYGCKGELLGVVTGTDDDICDSFGDKETINLVQKSFTGKHDSWKDKIFGHKDNDVHSPHQKSKKDYKPPTPPKHKDYYKPPTPPKHKDDYKPPTPPKHKDDYKPPTPPKHKDDYKPPTPIKHKDDYKPPTPAKHKDDYKPPAHPGAYEHPHSGGGKHHGGNAYQHKSPAPLVEHPRGTGGFKKGCLNAKSVRFVRTGTPSEKYSDQGSLSSSGEFLQTSAFTMAGVVASIFYYLL